VYTAGALVLDDQRREVRVNDRMIPLTRKEYELLGCLLRSPGQVFTRDQLLQTVWGYPFDGENRTVDVHIRTLRQKLGEAGEQIETVRGIGYKIGGRS
jgi:two-component system alkaline phosphatase synthesis response regulator PhoP